MSIREEIVTIPCVDATMLGVVAHPAQPAPLAVVIVVGGPQYRVGSHRQFLLLSRALAAEGYPTLRFDCRGMGDSDGVETNFEQTRPDIAAAINAIVAACPGVLKVVLWGLCDAASASLLYWQATRDPRVAGLVLLNPWVRSAATLARTQVKHYYIRRLFQKEFWHKLASGNLRLGRALSGLGENLSLAATRPATKSGGTDKTFQDTMAEAMNAFPGQVLLILSGNDYTAKEFLECARSSLAWSGALERSGLTRTDVSEADHTFSTATWRLEVEQLTSRWLQQLPVEATLPDIALR